MVEYELVIPSSEEVDQLVSPIIWPLAQLLAFVIRREDGIISPQSFTLALSISRKIGLIFDEPNYSELAVLRAIETQEQPIKLILKSIRNTAVTLDDQTRVRIMDLICVLLPRIRTGIDELSKEVSEVLSVSIPESLRKPNEGYIAFNMIGHFLNKSSASHQNDSFVNNVRILGSCLDNDNMSRDLLRLRETKKHDAVAELIPVFEQQVNSQINAFLMQYQAQDNSSELVEGLIAAAATLEKVAAQRYVSVARRAGLLVRHLRDELHGLVEDAAYQFEADYHRRAEKKRWFNSVENADLNDSLVKNIEGRYRVLALRYQEQLDLLDRDISEYCEEFYRLSNEAFKPIAAYDFRKIVPKPSLELRLKASLDRGSNRALLTGGAAATATGMAVHAGLIAATSVTGLAFAPVGVAVLGTLALAGVWKAFSSPAERIKRDKRERPKTLEDALRTQILSNLPRYEAELEKILSRYRRAVLPEITSPKTEANRIRQIAEFHMIRPKRIADQMKSCLRGLQDANYSS
jgi:hypothetical protein